MENTGTGENANGTEQVATVESSQPSPKRGKKRTTKTERPITPAEAGQLLLSALAYCIRAGLPVTYYNADGKLKLSIDGLEIVEGHIIPFEAKE